MNFEDLKDQLIEKFLLIRERVEESSFYIMLKERYENLNKRTQKILQISIIAFVLVIIIQMPFSSFLSSSNHIDDFLHNRELIQDLLLASKISSTNTSVPTPPHSQALKSQIEDLLKRARLIPEQIESITNNEIMSSLFPEKLIQENTVIKINQLNVRQVFDIGAQLESLMPTIKLKDISIQANNKDTHYKDVTYTLVSLKLPQFKSESLESDDSQKKSRPQTKRKVRL